MGTPSAGNDITGMAIMGNQLFIVANGVIYQRTGAVHLWKL